MSFDLGIWVTESIISGVKQGIFAREYAAIKVADYLLKGVLSPEQAEQISNDAVYAAPVQPEAVLPQEPVVEIDPETGLPIEAPLPEPVEG